MTISIGRRELITALGSVAAWPLAARAQKVTKSYRLAFLALRTGQESAVVKQRLDELGYVEGKNLDFDFHSADGQPERLAELATAIVRTAPDVIVTGFGTVTAKAAQAATVTIPVVFTTVGDPIGSGIVKSLNRPGGNITGLTDQAAEITGKRLQIMQQLLPGITTVAVLVNPDTPFSALALQDLRAAATGAGIRLEVCEIRTADQLSTSIEAAAKAGATGLMILEDPLLVSLRGQIANLAAKLRLVATYGNREFVGAGGLLSYGTDRRQLYQRAAEIVDKILKGEMPADIPVERPTKFELVINLKTAKALGLNIPQTLLATADEVIE
jgi:putative ABC transport system substrate-binding protein